ncbi:amidohydrolase [Streptomyces inhibens]|uniref:amidohydrolase n=1 Tax=Streptomyces inhibens TaxID=2293571 RepID=UPI001C6E9142|nr:amidohydrolase [Streptomyces inhibens]
MNLSTAFADALRERSRARLTARQDDVIALSHSLHAEPELAYEETRSAAKIADLMEGSGFAVARGVCDLPTAFTATAGSGDLVIGICAEFDALPGIGHACGHNVNGAAAVAAALSLAEIADEIGVTVKLLGTPAEEYGGGKVDMIHGGAFDGVAAAMMLHAGPEDCAGACTLAISSWQVSYTGTPAHAAVMPHRGVNAADAMTLAQVAIGLQRQQMIPGGIVHGFVASAGEAPNVIPARADASYDCRAETLEDLRELQRAIRACFAAGALATGADLEIRSVGNDYVDLHQDTPMASLYADAASRLGRTVMPSEQGMRGASTDMGNVSHLVPSIHPFIGYNTNNATAHHPEFTRYGASDGADRAVLDGGLAMAWTAPALATDASHHTSLLGRLAGRQTGTTVN